MPGVMIGSTTISWEWVARASGIVAAALALMGLLIAGSNYPGVNAPTADVTTYYDKSHSKVMLTGLLFAISVTFFFWFIGAVVSTLREAGLGGWAATVLGLGTARGAFLMATVWVISALDFRIASSDNAAVVQAFQDLQWAARVISLFPAGALFFAAAVAFSKAGIFPAWYSWSFVPGGFIVFLGGTTWAHSGFWAPDGGLSYIAIAIGLSWMFITSALLLRLPPSPVRAPGHTAATPMP
jgi:hypothetical protein